MMYLLGVILTMALFAPIIALLVVVNRLKGGKR